MILSSRGLRFCLLGGDELARVQGLSGLGAGARVGGWLYEVDVVELLLDLEEIVRDRLARLDLQRIVQMNGSKLVESGWEVHELERVLALDFFEEGAAQRLFERPRLGREFGNLDLGRLLRLAHAGRDWRVGFNFLLPEEIRASQSHVCQELGRRSISPVGGVVAKVRFGFQKFFSLLFSDLLECN
uniref:Uncharacterized protein n=1 Tax=Strombidium inclinatum TaxID=197538 RepID=A0A7S3IUU1_9SPIT